MQTQAGARVLGPTQGTAGTVGSVGARFMVQSADCDGRFSLVEHPLPAHALTAPMHRHSREDEYTFVLEGSVAALLGDELVHADTGALIFKPRDQWHALWNASEEPARILEIISPAGLERLFEELPELPSDGGTPDLAAVAALTARYGVEFDYASVPRLVAEHGLSFGSQAH